MQELFHGRRRVPKVIFVSWWLFWQHELRTKSLILSLFSHLKKKDAIPAYTQLDAEFLTLKQLYKPSHPQSTSQSMVSLQSQQRMSSLQASDATVSGGSQSSSSSQRAANGEFFKI